MLRKINIRNAKDVMRVFTLISMLNMFKHNSALHGNLLGRQIDVLSATKTLELVKEDGDSI